MDISISNKISRYKNGDNEALKEILIQMEPLVIKYAKLTFSHEFEDAKQEYYIVIIKSCKKISICHTDAQCLKYITSAVKNKYCDFCKEHYSAPDLLPIKEDTLVQNYHYDDIIMVNDIRTFLSRLNDKKGYKKRLIYYSAYMEMSDVEIGKRLGLTRQYINLLRRELAKQFLSELK